MRGKKAAQAANRQSYALDNATATLRARHEAARAEWVAERAQLTEEVNKLRGELTREIDRRVEEQTRAVIADAERRVEEAVEEGRRKAGRLYEVAVLRNPDFDGTAEVFVEIAKAVGMQPGELLAGSSYATRTERRATHGAARRTADLMKKPDGPPDRNKAKHHRPATKSWQEARALTEQPDAQEQT